MYFALFLICVVWGSSFIFSKVLVGHIPASLIIFFRYFIAGVIFYAMFRKKSKITRGLLKGGLIVGTVNGVAIILQHEGLKYTTAYNSAFLTSVYVIFIPILEYFVWKKKISFKIVISTLMVLTGVYYLSFTDLSTINIGDIITLLGGVTYAFQVFLIGYYVKPENMHGLITMQFLIGSIISASYFGVQVTTGIIDFDPAVLLIPVVFWNLLALSTFGTLIPHTLQFYVQTKIPPTIAGIAYTSEPVFATILGMIILHEMPANIQFFGIALILTGIITANMKRKFIRRRYLTNRT